MLLTSILHIYLQMFNYFVDARHHDVIISTVLLRLESGLVKIEIFGDSWDVACPQTAASCG